MPDRTLDELLDQAIDRMLAGAPFETADPELATLIPIARALVDMPARGFRSRLKKQLERSTSMTSAAPARIRKGFRSVTPYISVTEGDRLIEFLSRTFGAEEVGRSRSPAGFHAEVRIGESMVMVGSGEALRGNERLGAFHVYVPDCDAAYARAVDAGATSTGEPEDRPYGERSGFVKDFAGNHWYIATRFGDAFAPEGLGTVLPFLLLSGARAFIEFVKRAFGAEEMAVFEQGGRVMHGAVRIGDSVMEMGEPEEQPVLRSRFFLYVDDCDAAYRRALEAGATTVEPPADQPYGHRTAAVADPFGYEWVTATLL
jgi:PhnB protein